MSDVSKGKQSRIRQYMKNVLNIYQRIRGNNRKNFETRFWDAVIISASDESQKFAYERQLLEKQKKKELPLDVPFHVFADKPGFKNGCGGSTMYVLEKLASVYGSELSNMCLLLIPAGGFSQRLPSLSVLGKLFCPLPFGEPFYQMIDLILASYLPFLQNMPAGIFLASSDAIISYYLSQTNFWTFKNEGFTALAHPSPIYVGVGHGVYVLPQNQDSENSTSFMSDCLKVLQKPTEDEMYEYGAVVNCRSQGCGEEAEIIYSDSAFFFDQSIVSKLINFYKNTQPLNCEISSYGDFLRPLGLNVGLLHLTHKNPNDNLMNVKSLLYKTLHGSRLSVLVLKESRFHHLGTMTEYIESFCCRNDFYNAFPVSRFSCSAFSDPEVQPTQLYGTVVHSVIHPLTSLPASSVLEYCDFSIALDIGDNCLLSNCQFGSQCKTFPFKIPENTLLHTVPLDEYYVTIACAVSDDIKKSYTIKEALCVKFCNVELNLLFRNGHDIIFHQDSKDFSLWNAKLFLLCPSMEESFRTTAELVVRATHGEMGNFFEVRKDNGKKLRVSMQDILSLKNVEKMMSFQNDLYKKIMASK